MEANNPVQGPIVSSQLNQQPTQGEILKQRGYFLPILIAIIVLVVIGAGGYFLYQRQTKPTTVPQPVSQPTPSPTSTDETANWKIYSAPSGKFSFKYPSNLILAENPRNPKLENHPYFFQNENDYKSYLECLRLADIPESPGKLARDFEYACDLNKVLFSVQVNEDKSITGSRPSEVLKSKSTPIEVVSYSDLQGRKWFIFKDLMGGLGESIYFEADLESNGKFYYVTISTPDAVIESYLGDSDPEIQKFFKQILSTFKFTQ